MYILVAMYILRYICISTTPHVWSRYPSHKLLHFPNPGIQFQTIYKLTLYCPYALHWALPHGWHHCFHTVWFTVQPRRGSQGKDVLGPGFQLETLHGNFQNNSDTSRREKKVKKDWKPEPKPNKRRSIKKLCDEVGCYKVFIMTCLERVCLTNAVILYSNAKQ